MNGPVTSHTCTNYYGPDGAYCQQDLANGIDDRCCITSCHALGFSCALPSPPSPPPPSPPPLPHNECVPDETGQCFFTMGLVMTVHTNAECSNASRTDEVDEVNITVG